MVSPAWIPPFKLFKNSLLTPKYRSPLLKLKGGKWGAEEPFNTINSYSGNVVGAPIGGGQYGGWGNNIVGVP